MRFILTFTLLFSSLMAFSQYNDDYKCATINKDDFYSDMKLNPGIKVIDVSSRSEFRAERIENAINIPYRRMPCRKARKMDRETILYLYCKSGVRSCWAAEKFDKLGFKHIYSLDGGIIEWKKAGLPVLTGRKGIIVPQFIPLTPKPPIAPKPSAEQ